LKAEKVKVDTVFDTPVLRCHQSMLSVKLLNITHGFVTRIVVM